MEPQHSQIQSNYLSMFPSTQINPLHIVSSGSVQEHVSWAQHNHKYNDLKILIIQGCKPNNFVDDGAFVEHHIQLSMKQDGRAPDFLMLPENYHQSQNASINLNINRELKNIATVLGKYQVYGIVGTLNEFCSQSQKMYNTAVFIDRDGTILGSYRKRKNVTYHPRMGSGDRVGIYETAFGRVAVMICFDIENQDCLKETLEYNPVIIFNPTFIASRALKQMNHSSVTAAWGVALSSMSRLFENLCIQNRVSIIRCDQSDAASAMGTSQCISPYRTVYAPTRFDVAFSVYVDKPVRNPGHLPLSRLYSNNYSNLTNPPTYIRTDEHDNVGNRYRVHTMDASGYDRSRIVHFYDKRQAFAATKHLVHMYLMHNRCAVEKFIQFPEDILSMCSSVALRRLFVSTQGNLVHQLKVNEMKGIELIDDAIITKHNITSLAMLGDDTLVCGDETGYIHCYRASSSELLQSTKVHESAVTTILCVDSTIWSISQLENTIHAFRLTDTNDLKSVMTENLSSPILNLVLSACKKFVVVSLMNDEVIWIDAGSLKVFQVRRLPSSSSHNMSGLVVINPKYCITGSKTQTRLMMWNLNNEEESLAHEFHPPVCSINASGVTSLAFDGHSQIIALTNNDQQNMTLYSFISNQMPTKFEEIL